MVKIPGMNLLPPTHIFNNTERNMHVRLIGDSQSAVDVRRIKCLEYRRNMYWSNATRLSKHFDRSLKKMRHINSRLFPFKAFYFTVCVSVIFHCSSNK